MNYTRLQGKTWKMLKYNMTLIKYYINDEGRVKGIYHDQFRNKYSHWLNDEEIQELNIPKNKKGWIRYVKNI